MAVTNYISVGGALIGEVTSGVMRNYGTDALGAVVATYLNGALENEYAYKPYGSIISKTGTASDPTFLWNGLSGYRATKLLGADYYVTRRHFSTTSASWTTVDFLWPNEADYCYSRGNPVLLADPSGAITVNPSGCCMITGVPTLNVIAQYDGIDQIITVHPPNCPDYNFEYWVGAYFSVTIDELSIKPPPRGGCGLTWSEWWTGETGYTPRVNNCAKKEFDLCAPDSSCSMYDLPGFDLLTQENSPEWNSHSGPLTYTFNICMQLQFLGCGEPSPQEFNWYLEFTSGFKRVVQPNGLYGLQQVFADVNTSSSSCNPGTTKWTYN